VATRTPEQTPPTCHPEGRRSRGEGPYVSKHRRCGEREHRLYLQSRSHLRLCQFNRCV